MTKLELLRAEFDQLRTQFDALNSEAGANPRADQRTELTRLANRSKDVRAEIDKEELDDARRDMNELSEWGEQVRRPIKHAVNADDDGRRSLIEAGWEIRGGTVHVPTKNGMHPMWSEEVLFGPMPKDPDVAEFYRTARAAAQPGYRMAYRHFLMSYARHQERGMAMRDLAPDEQRALAEGLDTTGGFAVPPDVQAEILVRVAQKAVMRRLCRVITTSRDFVSFPAIAPNASNGSIYSSGFVGGWVGEGGTAFSDTDPGMQGFGISIKQALVGTKLTNALVADAEFDILAFLAEDGSGNLSLVEDNGFIAGIGAALQPLGILNSGIATVDVEGSTANTISNTISAAGSAPKIATMYYTLPSQYAANAQWLMNRTTTGKVFGLVDANSRPWWQEMGVSGGANAAPRTLIAAPYNESPFVPDNATPTDGTKVMVFGDFSNYLIAQRSQMSTRVLTERFADSLQTGIIISERAGGGVWNTDAFRIGVV